MIDPGVYPDLDWRQYHEIDAVHHTVLWPFSRSPAHGRYEMLHLQESEALRTGHLVHLCVLEPSKYEAETVIAPKVDKRTIVGRQVWKDFSDASRGKEIVTPEEDEMFRQMSLSVHAHKGAISLLGGKGTNELSIIWDDAETKARCKGRLDRLVVRPDGWPFIVDLKTTKNASKAAWQQAIHRYKYHQQAAFYLDGANALAPSDRRFAWICVESYPPYAVACYEIDEASIDQGRDEYRQNLKTYLECKETNQWPGYPEEMDYAGLPFWAFKMGVASMEEV